jgi:arylsulfatase A-like enzyme
LRVLYIDIDSLRPDHLGCYGYHRATSPAIDALAADGVRFENCYVSDAPCLPSRTALWSGRFGFRTGVVGHGGTAAQPFIEGAGRQFSDCFGKTGWISALRRQGYFTATISPFGERHSAWHWYAGFNEVYNPGKRGHEIAADITPIALDWLQRHGRDDNWFLHLNYWDPHTLYRTPLHFGNPFAGEPLPAWLTEEVWERCWNGYGSHSAQEPHGFGPQSPVDPDPSLFEQYPRTPRQIDSMDALRAWIDGMDVGIRYADEHIGRVVETLADLGVLDDTAIVVSADHGEMQGELNVWGDHHTADAITCCVPLIVRWPGISSGRVDSALHYQYDWAATIIELLGGSVPANWDGRSFMPAFLEGQEDGREALITSQQAHVCQRGVRFDRYLCLQTYHDGYKDLEPVMLFDLEADPHEERNIADQQPGIANRGLRHLAEWYERMAATSPHDTDPMLTVLREGGPFHTRGELPAYLERLRMTGRGRHAETLAARHPEEARA